MKNIRHILSLLILLALPLLAQEPAVALIPEHYKIAIDSCDKFANSIKEKFTIPGMQITVMDDNQVLWSKNYGFRDLTAQLPMLSYNKMRIASVSKMFTSVGVMKLIEMGLVSPDSTIQTYVHNFPVKSHPITIRELLNHTSGIRHYINNEFNNPKKYKTIEEALNYFKNDSLMFEPGTKVLYSSYGYNLLGVLIEHVSQMPFKDYIYKYLLFPATLKYTMPDRVGNFIKNKSNYYYLDTNKIIRNTYDYDMSYKLPTGGYLSTSYEIAKFASELIDGKILDTKTLELYLSPTFLKDKSNTFWNMGLKSTQIDAKTNVYWQLGSTYGGCSAMAFEPKSRIAICWLNNMSVKWNEEEILQLMKYILSAEKTEKKLK